MVMGVLPSELVLPKTKTLVFSIRVKNAYLFPRDLYVRCSLVPTSDHIIKRTLHGSYEYYFLVLKTIF